ncbi:MAG TPA: hypothetical protein VF402_07925, partial [Asticcacaulis sp.]
QKADKNTRALVIASLILQQPTHESAARLIHDCSFGYKLDSLNVPNIALAVQRNNKACATMEKIFSDSAVEIQLFSPISKVPSDDKGQRKQGLSCEE